MMTLLAVLLAASTPADASTLRSVCSEFSRSSLKDTEACQCQRATASEWVGALDRSVEPPRVDDTCFEVNRIMSAKAWADAPEAEEVKRQLSDKAWNTALRHDWFWNPITNFLDSLEDMHDISDEDAEPMPFGQATSWGPYEIWHYKAKFGKQGNFLGWEPEWLTQLDTEGLPILEVDKASVTSEQSTDLVVLLQGGDVWILPGPHSPNMIFTPPPDEDDEPQATCEDSCGGIGADSSCYCDAACVSFGDCCDDYADFCVDEPEPPATNTCADSCGTASPDGTCWCDDACTTYGDCCDDYADECLAPAGDSCADSCGGASPDASCYCDSACSTYGDCCDDYTAYCTI